MKHIPLLWWLSIGSYSALLLLLVLWFSWLAPPEVLPRSMVLLIMTVPLLFPLRGLLYGRPFTFAWTSFLALFYFIHGVTEAYSDPSVRFLASLEIVFSTLLYTSTMLYARYRGKQIKAEQAQAADAQKG